MGELRRTSTHGTLAIRSRTDTQLKRSLHLPALFAACLLNACAMQTYEPKPLAPAQSANAFYSRNLQSDALRQFMISQGYPQAAWPIKSWGLSELTLAALFFHPELAVARAKLAASQAAIETAGKKPNPTLSPVTEYHSRTEGGVSPWTLGLSLAIPIEVANKRAIRIDQANHLAEIERLAIGETAWKIYARLRDRLAELGSLTQRIETLEREIALRSDIVAMLESRLAAGMIASSELAQDRRLHLQAQQSLAVHHQSMSALRAEIAAAIGIPHAALADIAIAPVSLPDHVESIAASPGDLQQAALLNRLDIRAGLARYAAAESALELEIAKQYPDFELSPGYSFDQNDNVWSLGLNLLLALQNKNEGPIAEARANRELAAKSFMQLQARVIAEQEQARANALASLTALEKMRQVMQQQTADHALLQRQFEKGYLDRLSLKTAETVLLGQEQGLVEARIRLMQHLGQLEDAAQKPLNTTGLPLGSDQKESFE